MDLYRETKSQNSETLKMKIYLTLQYNFLSTEARCLGEESADSARPSRRAAPYACPDQWTKRDQPMNSTTGHTCAQWPCDLSVDEDGAPSDEALSRPRGSGGREGGGGGLHTTQSRISHCRCDAWGSRAGRAGRPRWHDGAHSLHSTVLRATS